MPIEYMYCFICSEQCMKNITSCQYVELFSSVFNKIIPDATTHFFQKVGGVTRSSYLTKGKIFSQGIMLTTTKLVVFLLARHSYYFVCYCLRLK